MRRLLLSSLGSLLVLGIAPPASASVLTECIAANYPKDRLAAMSKDYVDSDRTKPIVPDPTAILALWSACLPSGDKSDEALVTRYSKMVAAHLMVTAATHGLTHDGKLTPKAIDAAWSALSPDARARFGRQGKFDADAQAAMLAFAGKLRPDIPAADLNKLITSPPTDPAAKPYMALFTDVTVYGLGRGAIEADR